MRHKGFESTSPAPWRKPRYTRRSRQQPNTQEYGRQKMTKPRDTPHSGKKKKKNEEKKKAKKKEKNKTNQVRPDFCTTIKNASIPWSTFSRFLFLFRFSIPPVFLVTRLYGHAGHEYTAIHPLLWVRGVVSGYFISVQTCSLYAGFMHV